MGTTLETQVKRIVVVGGSGMFGRTAIAELGRLGISAVTASRRGVNGISLDANDATSIRNSLSANDLVIDAAGPFQQRSMALLDAAIEIGFDLIDINEDLTYAEQVLARRNRIAAVGIRVLSSASSASAVAATVVKYCNVTSPIRVTACLAPALRHTAHRGVALAMLLSLGRPVRTWRDGAMQSIVGRPQRRFQLPEPIGNVTGRLFENTDSLYLPLIWPSLRGVEMYVAARTPTMGAFLNFMANWPTLRRQSERFVGVGTWFARKVGPSAGGIGYEIESADGNVTRVAIVSNNNSFITAVAPAVLAAKKIVAGRFAATGLILPDQHVETIDLLGHLGARGIEVQKMD
jgi:saccharopine dehydrogenase-like NADP-dependent oxidoreductase